MNRGCLLVVILSLLATIQAAEQQPESDVITIYLAAEPVQWNYAPLGINNCTAQPFNNDTGLWTSQGLGPVYLKGRFLQYQDDAFSEPVQRTPDDFHLGLVGSIIRAQPGQQIVVYLLNRLSFPINIEPTGLLPAVEDFAPVAEPDEIAVYQWVVPDEAAPQGDDEPDTKLWIYRSTLEFEAHTHAGLVGAILISRPGSTAGTDADTGKDIITFFNIMNEAESAFADVNLDRPVDLDPEDYQSSLLKHSINGYLFCNLPHIDLDVGSTVRWHLASVGSETDLHSAHWHGQTVVYQGHRVDVVRMIPGSTASVLMEAREVGAWLFHCHVNDHLGSGMVALYNVLGSELKADDTATNSTSGQTRKYYIAAEEVEWDFTPLGGNACGPNSTVEPWSEDALVFTSNATGFIGSKYLKARFIEYTDDTFTTVKPRPPTEAYLGILGPIIRAEVGDTIEVVFNNKLSTYPASVHPHGVQYTKAFEGAPYNDGINSTEGDVVPPGEIYTYIWTVPESAGPGPGDGSSTVWLYHSHVNEISDTYAGLVGAVIIGRSGSLDAITGIASDVDKEVVLLFMVNNERGSIFWPDNAAALAARDSGSKLTTNNSTTEAEGTVNVASIDEELGESAAAMTMTDPGDWSEAGEPDLMHSINGYLYCNMPEVELNQGESVRFHVLALGTEVDMHTPVIQSTSFQTEGETTPALYMMPGVGTNSDAVVVADVGSELMIQCRVADHVTAGMQAKAKVVGGSSTASNASKEPSKTYYIAADVVEWNYAPLGGDACGLALGGDIDKSNADESAVFLGTSDSSIGSVYTKGLYRAYTNESFTTLVESPASHGMLGPLITVEVGQVLEIVFKNNLPFDVNLVIDGGFVPLSGYANPLEPVASNTSQPTVYRYLVTPSAGPDTATDGEEPLNTVAYGYTSSVDLGTHHHAGLVGIALVGAAGTFTNSTVPTGADAVLPLVSLITDEGSSPFFETNMENAGLDASNDTLTSSAEFVESNLMHSFNGYVYCNIPSVTIPVGSTLRVAALGFGSEADLHSTTFTGQVLKSSSERYSATAGPLLPAMTRVYDLVATQPGDWVFYCETHDHELAGMKGLLTVTGQSQYYESADGGETLGYTSTTAAESSSVTRAFSSWMILVLMSSMLMILLL